MTTFDIVSPVDDPGFREFGSDLSFADLRLTHSGYNTRCASSWFAWIKDDLRARQLREQRR